MKPRPRHLRLAVDPASVPAPAPQPREVWKVRRVAGILDLHDSQVRELVRTGQLESQRIGKRGIRVFVDSVAAYQAARSAASPAGATTPKVAVLRRRQPRNPGDAEAVAFLRSKGIAC